MTKIFCLNEFCEFNHNHRCQIRKRKREKMIKKGICVRVRSLEDVELQLSKVE